MKTLKWVIILLDITSYFWILFSLGGAGGGGWDRWLEGECDHLPPGGGGTEQAFGSRTWPPRSDNEHSTLTFLVSSSSSSLSQLLDDDSL